MVRVPTQIQIDSIFSKLRTVAISIICKGQISHELQIDDAVTLPEVCAEICRQRRVRVVYPWLDHFRLIHPNGTLEVVANREAAGMLAIHTEER